jgi:hypothetical protein
MSLRFLIHSAVIVIMLISANGVVAQGPLRVESESRDAAAAFIGTQNFMIGRIGRECLATMGRTDTPQQFVQAWQARNAKYYLAHTKYMVKRLDEALSEGGTAKRDAILASYSTSVKRNGEGAANVWLSRGERTQACERVIASIESGASDITSGVPIFEELEALSKWAQ